jgi:hypothetical protein
VAHADPEVGLPELGCSRCDWVEGSESDFGYVPMEARPFCPDPPEEWGVVADPIEAILRRMATRLGVPFRKLQESWPSALEAA